jgi:hypothetical protein
MNWKNSPLNFRRTTRTRASIAILSAIFLAFKPSVTNAHGVVGDRIFLSPVVGNPHELEFTLSPILILPTGNRQIADQGYTHLGGEALLAKGFGDLPDSPSVNYLRPFALQAEVGYAGRIQGPANSDVFGNLELEYSLKYLDRYVKPLNVGHPWADLVPYVQLNYAQSFIASRLTTKPDFRLTPGLAYMGHYYELSVGAQIELNHAAPSDDRVAVLGLVEIFYDDIFPALSWKPF